MTENKKRYRAVWHDESGALKKGVLTTWNGAVFDFGYVVSKELVAWIEDEEGNKITEAPAHV